MLKRYTEFKSLVFRIIETCKGYFLCLIESILESDIDKEISIDSSIKKNRNIITKSTNSDKGGAVNQSCTNKDDKISIIRKRIKEKWYPTSFDIEFAINDVNRRAMHLEKDYDMHKNRCDLFTMEQTSNIENKQFSTEIYYYSSDIEFEIQSMMCKYQCRKNSKVCSEWKFLSPLMLDLFLRLHRVLDRKNILAAEELLEEIKNNLSPQVTEAEFLALNNVNKRLELLKQEKTSSFVKRQKEKFKIQFNKLIKQ